jgi:NADH-quinone oxidoreductase subunit A
LLRHFDDATLIQRISLSFSKGFSVEALLSVTIFVVLGAVFVFANLMLGSFLRPTAPSPEKSATYECGEPAMGPSWVQFDLRFYIIALLYLVFDVEVALFYPWAVVYGNAAAAAKAAEMTLYQYRQVALIDMLLFFGLVVLGFAYLWRFGYLDWVRRRQLPETVLDTVLRSDRLPDPPQIVGDSIRQ